MYFAHLPAKLWKCTRINLLLAFNLIEKTPSDLQFAAKLKHCVDCQTPKWRGFCWRGALHSPFEILMMALKGEWFLEDPLTDQASGTFYYTSFFSSSTNTKSFIFNRFDDESYKTDDDGTVISIESNRQNCIFEIDASEFFERSTMIQYGQTEYETENENLFSCYNVFEWVGYQLVKYQHPKDDRDELIPLIRLKVKNPETAVFAADYLKPSADWIRKKGQNACSRTWSPSGLHSQFTGLRESLRREATKQGKPFPANLMADVTDAFFKKHGFASDENPYPENYNLYDRPEQDGSNYVNQNETPEATRAGLPTTKQ
jgi:hypothetical protein